MSGPAPRRAPHLPEPRFSAKRVGGMALVLLLLFGISGFFLWLIVNDVRNVWNRYALDHEGVRTTAQVVGTRTEAGEEGPGPTFLRVAFGANTAEVEVSSGSHPVGSLIQIAYDPADSSRAIATEDAPVPLGVGSFWVALILIGLVATSISRLRRGKVRERHASHAPTRVRPTAVDAQVLLENRPSRSQPHED